MALIKSISGIRGTIGGRAGEGLTPLDIVRFSAAYAKFMKQNAGNDSNKIVVGRDARISGDMVYHLVAGTLSGQGLEVVNIGLATTPTTELAVIYEKALGGIILTASHNPMQWNALKLLNEKGEFLNAKEGEEVLKIAAEENFDFASVEQLGKISENFTFLQKHIDNILSLNLVEVDAIKKADFTVAIDAVNSVGGIAVPALLEALGVKKVIKLNCEPTGIFAHNPEPLPEHLSEISSLVKESKADVGFVVDPDVDRLAIICEDGSMFGEEYTLVAVADYVLQHTPGNTVSNLSSSRALRDITQKRGGKYSAAAVGEVNVVTLMKQTNAVIGGEGNGGVIYPASHYGRDALVGIALFLSYLAKSKKTVSALKNEYPQYFISKNKIELTPSIDVDKILATIKNNYQLQYEVNDIDGVKIDFPTGWVHLRKSNTEPIIRIYAEAKTKEQAEAFANAIMEEIRRIAAA
ncbi:MAG TPA: phosphoglucosamine mutase [Paludibacteraceae bacterium]|jgi:phosphomannomutase|nr:phosphoglucosamine mutase [Paludibacteraceae bacterium]OPZ02492.1 MAG: Phosphomannomutase/phosphoglucomutase [Bacteroidetes bacterium ADurb.BinA395]MBP8967036.1 phosphoglucosamine mutase [Paludibacteraceae bacterium]HOF98718.1 phosphoglucosamine mutase [Paludibacteraceae bacterium]HOJ65998.1 phosphoglucosamine mutase [Paludibacteraceae bacterium]